MFFQKRKSILIVDDSQVNCKLVSALLQSLYDTRVATSGAEALRLVEEGVPDLILLDVMMPEMDGYAVCAELKSRPTTRDIPVLFLTGQDDDRDEVRGFDSGGVDYLTKPIKPPVLLARVKTHLERAGLYQEKNYVTELLRHTLLPKVGFSFLGVEVGHRFVPSKLLSGDFYDLIAITPRKLGLVMADVAGKGPDAAIQTVRAKFLIRALALAGTRPVEILELLNRELAQDPDSRALTAFYAEIDLDQACLTYCNCGHEPGQLWVPARQAWQELGCTAMMLGAMDPLEGQQETVALEAGSCLVLFTDGVTEARSPSGDFLGAENLLKKVRPQSAGELVEQLFQETFRFANGNFSDDVSMLALRLP